MVFVFKGYCLVKEFHLHAEDGEDVDDDKQDEGEVAQGAQCRDDDAQQHLDVEHGDDEECEMCWLSQIMHGLVSAGNTFMVVHDCANFKTRICNKE